MSLIFVVVESLYSISSKFSCNQFGVAVKLLADLEMVQMAVRPAHCRLDVFVEFVEGAVLDLDSPPDRGMAFEQGDLELVHRDDGRGRLRFRLGDAYLEAIHQCLGNQKQSDLLPRTASTKDDPTALTMLATSATVNEPSFFASFS